MHLPGGGAQADDALADAQPVRPTASGSQPLGRDQLQDVAGPHRVDRAHLGSPVRPPPGARAPASGAAPCAIISRSRASSRRAGVTATSADGRRWPRRRSRGDEAATACSTSSAMIAATGCSARDHADRLAGHHRAGLDIAVDHRAAQRAGPEMLDLELRRLLGQLAGLEPVAASPPGARGSAWCPH